MSETMALPPLNDAAAKKTPTVYFIDDSATMREVIKIAFRRENFNVITCGDAASALSQFDQNPPDAVITDVIMPDQDGYSVCTQVKQHEKFGHIPVILMSGVVNKTVADKAVGVKADELIRKPFQPQELIGRVKALLNPKSTTAPAAPAERPSMPSLQQPQVPGQSPASLSSLFAPPQPISAPPQPHAAQSFSPNAGIQPPPENPWPRALADAFTPPPVFANPPAQRFQQNPTPPAPAHPGYPQQPSQPIHGGYPNQNQHPGQPQLVPQAPQQPRQVSADLTKLRAEIARLELQVKKLQTEVQIERQYNQALEAQIHAYTHSD
jgi:twitching motility two-component system response regulator PilH